MYRELETSVFGGFVFIIFVALDFLSLGFVFFESCGYVSVRERVEVCG